MQQGTGHSDGNSIASSYKSTDGLQSWAARTQHRQAHSAATVPVTHSICQWTPLTCLFLLMSWSHSHLGCLAAGVGQWAPLCALTQAPLESQHYPSCSSAGSKPQQLSHQSCPAARGRQSGPPSAPVLTAGRPAQLHPLHLARRAAHPGCCHWWRQPPPCWRPFRPPSTKRRGAAPRPWRGLAAPQTANPGSCVTVTRKLASAA